LRVRGGLAGNGCGWGGRGLAARETAFRLLLGPAFGFGFLSAACVFLGLASLGGGAFLAFAGFAFLAGFRLEFSTLAFFDFALPGTGEGAGTRLALFIGQ
jgi:hypothetical protein